MPDFTRDGERPYRHPWLGVEVRHLATLGAVARTGSFRQAARDLGYVRSAVSQQVARLEQVVGCCLVERHRGQRTVRLTKVGEVLAERGERMLAELYAARIDLSTRPEAAPARLRLGVAPDCAAALEALLLRRQLPHPVVTLIEVDDDQRLIRMLETGHADAVVGVALSGTGITSRLLGHDPFVLLVRTDSRLAAEHVVSSPDQLAGERLIVPASVLAHGHLHAPGLELHDAIRVPYAAAVPALVSHGHGTGLLPRSALRLHAAGGLIGIATAGLIAPQRLTVAHHAARKHAQLHLLSAEAA